MQFEPAPNGVPKKHWMKQDRKNIQQLIQEFQNAPYDTVIVETDPGEYASIESLISVVKNAVRRSNTGMHVSTRDGVVYISK